LRRTERYGRYDACGSNQTILRQLGEHLRRAEEVVGQRHVGEAGSEVDEKEVSSEKEAGQVREEKGPPERQDSQKEMKECGAVASDRLA
jgi:hypothetical protein